MDSTVWLVLLLGITASCEATSWKSKEKERAYKIDQLKRGDGGDWIKKERCQDKFKPDKCREMNDLCGLMVVRKKCAETCGVCRASAPPDCSITKYKCCWDNTTIAMGPNNEGCPSCADKFFECKLYQSSCDSRNFKMLCPNTCGIPCNTQICEDNQYQKAVCPMYKEFGFCKISPKLMERMCALTCGFCQR